jgi:hypothetical protein
MMYAPEYDDAYTSSFTKQYKTIIDWTSKTTRSIPAGTVCHKVTQRLLPTTSMPLHIFKNTE